MAGPDPTISGQWGTFGKLRLSKVYKIAGDGRVRPDHDGEGRMRSPGEARAFGGWCLPIVILGLNPRIAPQGNRIWP